MDMEKSCELHTSKYNTGKKVDKWIGSDIGGGKEWRIQRNPQILYHQGKESIEKDAVADSSSM